MHIEPTRDAIMAFLGRGIEGPVVMLNLLRFREVADYSTRRLDSTSTDHAPTRSREMP